MGSVVNTLCFSRKGIEQLVVKDPCRSRVDQFQKQKGISIFCHILDIFRHTYHEVTTNQSYLASLSYWLLFNNVNQAALNLGHCRSSGQQSNQRSQFIPHFAPVHNHVYRTMRQ